MFVLSATFITAGNLNPLHAQGTSQDKGIYLIDSKAENYLKFYDILKVNMHWSMRSMAFDIYLSDFIMRQLCCLHSTKP